MHKISNEFEFRPDRTTDYGVSCPWTSKKISHRLIMGKWCLHASSFIFVRIIIIVAGNQDRHKSMVESDFGPTQTTHFGVTCPWVTKISDFWTWISLKRGGQSWSNFMCSIIGVGERLHKVLGLIDLGTLDSGEWSLPFGLLDQIPENWPLEVISTVLLYMLAFFSFDIGTKDGKEMGRYVWPFIATSPCMCASCLHRRECNSIFIKSTVTTHFPARPHDKYWVVRTRNVRNGHKSVTTKLCRQ